MAIRDLLWACPLCGTEGGIRPARKGEACGACGARFRRGRGSSIVAETAGGEARTLPAAAWADLLPDIEATERFRVDGEPGRVLHRARTRARFAVAEAVVRLGLRYMNRIERFGPPSDGELVLHADRLSFAPDDGAPEAWAFDEITAVQPSSSTLQVKARGRPVASFRFPEDSARFWEELLCAALRRHYRAAGRGEIVEFQPRIATR
ncbi:MAG TPA: hypothetical protein VF212_08100 [Longimicrobiales bacterium]